MAGVANVADAKGLTFECQPGCGFCCTAAPLVLTTESSRLGPLVVRSSDDGTLRIPIQGQACSALGADRRCTVYEARPSVCHLYPYAVHAGRRIQVTVSLACPGVDAAHPTGERDNDGQFIEHPFGVANHAEDGATRAATLALAQPGAVEMAASAKDTFAEFDRRMKEWGHAATSDKLRSAFLPALADLARPAILPAFFAGIHEGDLELSARDAVTSLFAAEAEATLDELLVDAARDAFGENDDVLWVEPHADYAWVQPRFADGRVTLRDGIDPVDPESLPTEWTMEASDVLAAYLRRLCARDHTEGAAAWLVDASGYRATPAAAFARVLGEASLQVALRAGLAAVEADADEVTPALAWRGVRAYETSFHSLPTLGSIL